jgi:hypothetical protein
MAVTPDGVTIARVGPNGQQSLKAHTYARAIHKVSVKDNIQ